jgi:hypothetical protein
MAVPSKLYATQPSLARNATCRPHAAALLPTRGKPMLDIVYILIGALFLGGCVLYAIACDHL